MRIASLGHLPSPMVVKAAAGAASLTAPELARVIPARQTSNVSIERSHSGQLGLLAQNTIPRAVVAVGCTGLWAAQAAFSESRSAMQTSGLPLTLFTVPCE